VIKEIMTFSINIACKDISTKFASVNNINTKNVCGNFLNIVLIESTIAKKGFVEQSLFKYKLAPQYRKNNVIRLHAI